MAVNVNTVASMKRASTALGGKCEETKKNMKALAKRVYKDGVPKMEKVTIPNIPGLKDDVIPATVNGVKFYFLRGDAVEMPEAVAEVLRNSGLI